MFITSGANISAVRNPGAEQACVCGANLGRDELLLPLTYRRFALVKALSAPQVQRSVLLNFFSLLRSEAKYFLFFTTATLFYIFLFFY